MIESTDDLEHIFEQAVKEAERKIPFFNSIVKPLAKATKKVIDNTIDNFKKDKDQNKKEEEKLDISYTEVSEGGKNNKDNTFSMLFFNSSLIVVGAVLIIFYQYSVSFLS